MHNDYEQISPISADDKKTVLHCIKIIEARSSDLKAKGLSSWRFFFGVTNTLLVVWCFGAYPQHFWAVYMLETLILFPLRYSHTIAAKPLNEVPFFLDFCWIANVSCNMLFILIFIDSKFDGGIIDYLDVLDRSLIRKVLFCTWWGIATGPLLCAVGALGNALVFHDSDNTVSVFIHLFPSLVVYTFRWNVHAVLKAWPGLWHLDYFDDVDPWRDVYVNAILAYFVWWVVYSLWMVTCGFSLPSKGYDTIYHCLMRGSNPVGPLLGWTPEESKRRAKENDFTYASFFLYMVIHALCCCSSIIVAVACWYSQYFHGFTCLAMTLATVYRGSARYSYYMLQNYTAILKKEFGDVLEENKGGA
jgi:hypothetical protein